MDIYEARRKNLKRLINEEFDSNQALFASFIGVKPPQVSRWLNASAADKRKITEDSARKIEKKCKKEEGWLDIGDLIDPGVEPEQKKMLASGYSKSMASGAALLLRAWSTASSHQRTIASAWARSIIHEHGEKAAH